MKVLPGMTDDLGLPLGNIADFLAIDGIGWKLLRDGDVGVMVLGSTEYPNLKARFSAADLMGIAGRCAAIAVAITTDYGDHDPYSEEIRKEFTRNG